MGLVMSPGSVVAQLNQMNQNLQEGIGNAAHALGTVTALQNTESVLIGESYDSVRAYYSTLHVPLLQGMILFAQMLIQENNNYKSCIQSHLAGIGYIDEDELERDKENIQRQINHVYSLMSVSKLSYSSYLGCLQNALALVEKKLRQIDDFLGASAGLYAGMDSYQINIRNGLKEIGGKHFDRATGKYDLAAVKLGWKKDLQRQVVQRDINGNEKYSHDERLDELCLEYIRNNMPQLLQVENASKLPSEVVEKIKRNLEIKYTAALKRYLLEEESVAISVYVNGSGIPSDIMQIYRENIERQLSNIIVKIDESGIVKFCKVITIGGWLKLYSVPTVDGVMRCVEQNPKANIYDWGMPEDLCINGKMQEGDITSVYRDIVISATGKEPIVNVLEDSKLYTDAEGRYYVAVGPNIMNPNHQPEQKITVEEMNYGTKIDIVVLDENTQQQYYIPAVVADVKAHTYPDGNYQTNLTFPYGEAGSGDNADGSTVEFIGYNIPDQTVNVTNNYRIQEIIVYDGEVNY